jgi:hypothetical protein
MTVDEIIDVVVKPGSRKLGLSSENGTLVLRGQRRNNAMNTGIHVILFSRRAPLS